MGLYQRLNGEKGRPTSVAHGPAHLNPRSAAGSASTRAERDRHHRRHATPLKENPPSPLRPSPTRLTRPPPLPSPPRPPHAPPEP